MKKQTLAILACAVSALFAQTVAEMPSIDPKLTCKASFDEVYKNSTAWRDAAADRMSALVATRIYVLDKVPEDKRNGQQYETELKLCHYSVKLFKLQLERVALTQKYIDAQKEIILVKDSLMNSLNASFGNERARLESQVIDSKRAIAEKDYLLTKQKEEAEKKLDALRSKTISVYKDVRGTILSMSDILFETAKADLKPELKENLAEIAGILKNLLTGATVVIEGHTDNVGNAAANKKLSEQRASEVSKYLASRGVAKNRLKAIGYGLTKPIADNATDEGKAKNRRVELVIKDK
jgi:outer membrane protein OmpA-like peptidoglycan-associated protein